MNCLAELPIVRIRENKVKNSNDVSMLSIFLSKVDYMYNAYKYVPINNEYVFKWACRDQMRVATINNISNYIAHIEKEKHLLIFNMSNMVDNVHTLIKAINTITLRFKEVFIIISSEHTYDPTVLDKIIDKDKVSLITPHAILHTNNKCENYFRTKLEKSGFVCEKKARCIVSGKSEFILAPEVHYANGSKSHVSTEDSNNINTNNMVCTSGIYMNPDGDIVLCPNDINGLNRDYIYDNINNPLLNKMPVVNMCRGQGCPGSINKHVRTLMEFANE